MPNRGKARAAPPPAQAGAGPSGNSRMPAALVIAYVTLVLAVDTLAGARVNWPVSWSWFHWQPRSLALLCEAAELPGMCFAWLESPWLQSVDLFKFTFWFLVPFLCCVPCMDWGWFGVTRWKRIDALLLALFLGGCIGAVLLIPHLPGVREYYRQFGGTLSASERWSGFLSQALWTVSWLTGWEFLHRYLLLRRADAQWPRYGWLLVPLSEVAYHLQKPLIEAAGMGLFSLLATPWTRLRKNMLGPFVAHLTVELALAAFLAFG